MGASGVRVTVARAVLLPLAAIVLPLKAALVVTGLELYRRQQRREALPAAESAPGIRELERWLSCAESS
jgi:hypothetical protein